MRSQLPDRLMIAAGTYDGVLAGWDNLSRKQQDAENNDNDNDKDKDIDDEEENAGGGDLLQMLNNASMNKNQDENAYLKMNFGMVVHDGSVRCLSIAPSLQVQQQQQKQQQHNSKKKKKNDENTESSKSKTKTIPGVMLSAGYDESISMFNLAKYTQSGELKTPSDLGMPTCSSFAPPNEPSPSHVLLGTSSGKIVIYKRNDMSVQHILPGHGNDDNGNGSGGVNCIAVHPTGKMALSGGRDGKICLWDLMRGRLAFVYKIPNPSTRGKRKSTVNHIVWSDDGKRYAYCTHEGNITAREMETGQDLLDINMHPGGRANQVCFIGGEDGLFLAAACNDGGLPVFAVGSVDEDDEEAGTRRAIMAIEPVVGVATAGDERFKCIQTVKGGTGFLVVTANSGGIISVIDLEGAGRMMLADDDDDDDDDDEEQDEKKEKKNNEDDSEDEDDEEEDTAAEILESVRIGSGARITCIAAWSHSDSTPDFDEEMEQQEGEITEEEEETEKEQDNEEEVEEEVEEKPYAGKKRKPRAQSTPHDKDGTKDYELEMDPEALERARALVSQAKKRQKKKKSKKKSKKANKE